MSGFFVAWCGIAIGMWTKARRTAKQRPRETSP
jgi:hypothetical protein